MPAVVGENPTSTELVQAVNANSAKINSLYCERASIGTNGFSGWAASGVYFDRPNKLRVRSAIPIGGQIMDCGCDGEQFWFWIKSDGPNYLYHCRLDQYQSSAANEVLPLDPTWFPEILGVVDIREEDILEEPVRQNDGSQKLIVKKTRADGVYRKHIFLESKTAAIKRQDVQAPDGSTVLSVVCKEHQYLEGPGIVLPRRIEIDCRTEPEIKIYLTLDNPVVNDTSKFAATIFQMPNDLNAKLVDLGATSPSNAASQSSAAPASAATNSPSPATTPAPTSASAALSPQLSAAQTPVQSSADASAPAASTLPPGSGLTPSGRPYDASTTAQPYVGASAGIVEFPKVAANPDASQNAQASNTRVETLTPSVQLNSEQATAQPQPTFVANASSATFVEPNVNDAPIATNPINAPIATANATQTTTAVVQPAQTVRNDVPRPQNTFAPVYPGFSQEDIANGAGATANSVDSAGLTNYAAPSLAPNAATAPANYPTYDVAPTLSSTPLTSAGNSAPPATLAPVVSPSFDAFPTAAQDFAPVVAPTSAAPEQADDFPELLPY